MLFFLTSILALIFSGWLFSRAAGTLSLTRINMISFVFYFYFIIQSWVGSILIVNGLVSNTPLKLITDSKVFLNGWLSVQYAMIAVPSGMLLARLLFSKVSTRKLIDKFNQRPISWIGPAWISDTVLAVLSLISIVATVNVYMNLPSNPLALIAQGLQKIEVLEFRVRTVHDFSGNPLVKNVLSLSLAPFISYVYYAAFRSIKSCRYFAGFLIMGITSFFALTHNLAKSPFLMYLVGFLFLEVLICGKVSKRLFVSLTALVFLGMLFVFRVIENGSSWIELFTSNTLFLGRIFVSQISGMFLMMDIFPDRFDFLGWEPVISQFSRVFDFEKVDPAARIAMAFAYPQAYAEGRMNLLSTLFIGEAWASFGLIGIVAAPVYVGFVIQSFFLCLVRSRKTPLIVGLLAYFSFGSNFTSAFIPFLFSYRILALLIIVAISQISISVLREWVAVVGRSCTVRAGHRATG